MPFIPAASCGVFFKNNVSTEYKVTVTGGGSAKGIEDAANSISDLAMTSEPITKVETDKYGPNQLHS